MACNGLNKRSFHLFRHPKWSRIIFEKNTFLTHFDPFLVAKQPILKAFCCGFVGIMQLCPSAWLMQF